MGYHARILEIQARHEAQLDLMRIGLTLEQHYATHGVYPPSLDEVSYVLGGVPVDPFTGEAYRYLPEADSFTLYSLGRNFEDDGAWPNFRDGDIVWRGVYE